MGDIKVNVEKIKLRIYELCDNTIKANFYEEKNIDQFNMDEKGVVKQILTYTRLLSKEEKEIVGYPSIKPTDGKVYEWFGGYKRQIRVAGNRGTTIQKPTIEQFLPNIKENKILKKY